MSLDSMIETRKQLKQALSILEEAIFKDLHLWQSKATNGFVVEAIVQYRKEHGCSLSEAKDVVDSFLER